MLCGWTIQLDRGLHLEHLCHLKPILAADISSNRVTSSVHCGVADRPHSDIDVLRKDPLSLAGVQHHLPCT